MDHFLIDKLRFTGIIIMASFESAGVKEGDKKDRIGPAPQITWYYTSRSTHCTPAVSWGTSVHDLRFGLEILALSFLFQYCEQACFPVNQRREKIHCPVLYFWSARTAQHPEDRFQDALWRMCFLIQIPGCGHLLWSSIYTGKFQKQWSYLTITM